MFKWQYNYFTTKECNSVKYLEKVKERNVLHNLSQVFSMFEKEHIGQFSVKDVGMFSGQFDQVQSLLPTVSTSPESQRCFVFPRGAGVCLDREQI